MGVTTDGRRCKCCCGEWECCEGCCGGMYGDEDGGLKMMWDEDNDGVVDEEVG
jgi:hypothetical protein